ncbi:MAG: hypothetical protein OEW35_02115 [Gammaproteobacteria bacterium]|nr:hypothetical protein [Gammaproteobacteria bacterium]MDH4253433.1 hypothetical protein [Gammaproteobacteria bacterium]MDH5309204.1 hypothetical protein [Gammaproteobacteria bacterium]
MAALLLAGMLQAAGPAIAQQSVPACRDLPAYTRLDFWLGEWDVYVGATLAGRNRIESILDGCAVSEHWSAAGGGEGVSLFYVAPDGSWRQVWVTANAARPGGTKEKTELPGTTAGEIHFQGEIRTADGSYLDRTTLTRMEPDAVRQLIEVSTDGGASWRAVFDAVYRRRPAGGG